MPDCVVDATIIRFTNTQLAARKPGNAFDRRLTVLEQIVRGLRRARYNTRLLGEYTALLGQAPFRNDVIEAFFAILDSSRAVRVKSNRLSQGDHAMATRQCRWPSHDQHLLAAAIGGNRPEVMVTEVRLANCGPDISRRFGIRVVHIP